MTSVVIFLAPVATLAADYPVIKPGAARPAGFFQFGWAGHEWDDLSSRNPWSITSPDENTVRLELRSGDQMHWDAKKGTHSERSELAASYDGANRNPKGPGRPPIRTPVHIRYGLTIEPGPTNSATWFVLTQFHEDEVLGSPPVSLCLAGRSDVMTVNIAYTDESGKAINGPIWTDTAPVVRGKRYQIEQWIYVDPAGGGRLVVLRDGKKIVDYVGAIGYVGQTNSFWKFGPYRSGPTPETIAVRYDHMLFEWGGSVRMPESVPAASAKSGKPELTLSKVVGPFHDGSYRATLSGVTSPLAGVSASLDLTPVGRQTITVAPDGHFSIDFIPIGPAKPRRLLVVTANGVALPPLTLRFADDRVTAE